MAWLIRLRNRESINCGIRMHDKCDGKTLAREDDKLTVWVKCTCKCHANA